MTPSLGAFAALDQLAVARPAPLDSRSVGELRAPGLEARTPGELVFRGRFRRAAAGTALPRSRTRSRRSKSSGSGRSPRPCTNGPLGRLPDRRPAGRAARSSFRSLDNTGPSRLLCPGPRLPLAPARPNRASGGKGRESGRPGRCAPTASFHSARQRWTVPWRRPSKLRVASSQPSSSEIQLASAGTPGGRSGVVGIYEI